jgi:hypothetical protein
MKLTPTGREQSRKSKQKSGPVSKSDAQSGARSADPRLGAIHAAIDRAWATMPEAAKCQIEQVFEAFEPVEAGGDR